MNPFDWAATQIANLPGIRTRIAYRIANRACDALDATVRGDCKTGHRITRQILGRYGAGAAYPLVLAWSGAYIDVLDIPPGHEQVTLVFRNPFTGEITSADQVPPGARWSGRVLAARAAGDRETVLALISALPEDDKQRQRHLSELLHTIALVIEVHDRQDETP